MCYFHDLKAQQKSLHQAEFPERISPRGEVLNSSDSISLSFLPLSSANGVSILPSSYRPEVDVHTCVCPLLLPRTDLTLGKMPLQSDPFCLVWPPKNSPWDSRISKDQEQSFTSIPPAEPWWKRSVFSIYPTFCLFNACKLQTESASKSQEMTGWTWSQETLLYSVGPEPRAICVYCPPQRPVILGCLFGESLTGWDLP